MTVSEAVGLGPSQDGDWTRRRDVTVGDERLFLMSLSSFLR